MLNYVAMRREAGRAVYQLSISRCPVPLARRLPSSTHFPMQTISPRQSRRTVAVTLAFCMHIPIVIRKVFAGLFVLLLSCTPTTTAQLTEVLRNIIRHLLRTKLLLLLAEGMTLIYVRCETILGPVYPMLTPASVVFIAYVNRSPFEICTRSNSASIEGYSSFQHIILSLIILWRQFVVDVSY